MIGDVSKGWRSQLEGAPIGQIWDMNFKHQIVFATDENPLTEIINMSPH